MPLRFLEYATAQRHTVHERKKSVPFLGTPGDIDIPIPVRNWAKVYNLSYVKTSQQGLQRKNWIFSVELLNRFYAGHEKQRKHASMAGTKECGDRKHTSCFIVDQTLAIPDGGGGGLMGTPRQ
jgi:hypothetical protein